MKAFILVSLNEGNEQTVLDELKAMPEIVNAYVLFGEWDILTEVELSGVEELGSFVMEKIRSREDVKLTSTLVVAGK
ncbi:Lrp/AsnC ligand binding domain-containing protein [Candidatus Woesearchaeota archaeon]|jgi:anthranilate phosphoribosyltransferase|nr:Lrp/AsnC ligand binding domain-containing protein [Candidatus Woesearchaeota archaeon]MBT4110502.1 Lrp/AsnC ligand binding domain-containing protein [Candidatus Woesearchaeota archaeon]MBT4335974.1 Lrp/AsnC ligand binding domain-containing protein [Candidatus Woesearchaeota archaeon]MBT4469047.1 Lrp/AsnC ligand binding domain-containing protein [Candidatus Woesearchaeota archaeon]MBT6744634.1 Lrp/AsnC ligand binding domain-containing protein [Candidatus Woesearchaeota archaeon]